MTARTGDVIHTVEQLEAMPDRSVILDSHGDAWQQTGTLQEGDTTQAAWLGSVPASCRQSSAVDLPATVLHVPGEQAGRRDLPTRDEIARTIADYYGSRAGRDDAWEAVTDRQRAELLGVAVAVLALIGGEER